MRWRREDQMAGAAEHSKEPWHAVRVVAGDAACAAVVKLENTRFLSGQAPQLPLHDCSSPSRCKCTYRHFSDRRATAPRRWVDRTGLPVPRLEDERRKNRGRRRADVE